MLLSLAVLVGTTASTIHRCTQRLRTLLIPIPATLFCPQAENALDDFAVGTMVIPSKFAELTSERGAHVRPFKKRVTNQHRDSFSLHSYIV